MPPEVPHLSVQQKWRAAFSLILIYYPILVYLDYGNWDGTWWDLVQLLPSLLQVAVVMLVAFWGWLYVVEWLQDRLFRWFGEEFSLTMRWPALLTTVTCCLALAAAFSLIVGGTTYFIDLQLQQHGWAIAEGGEGPVNLDLWFRSYNGYSLMLMLSVFYLLANNRAQQRLSAAAYKSQQLEVENAQVQLAALKNQVNPHFLFNSLSILASLVETDTKLSVQFITNLARAYRYTLEQQDHDLVPLQTELTFIESYIFLLKIRFEGKFDVQLDVPPAARTAYHIAPLTLQLLVENAVKHSTMSKESPLHVHLYVEGDTLVVHNPLQGRPTIAPSTGVGLKNIHNRYRLLTPRPVQVSSAKGVFEVRIPLLPL
jgi:hypothetical protein